MQRQIETLGGALTKVIGELQNTSTLAMGVHKTIKNMPGYEEALAKLQEELKSNKDETKKFEE